MNNWKELGKHGRYGDTMMKKIDGDLAHVNAVEYEMSSEYIKEHGAGTINPITGKKEYFDPATVSLGLSIGSSIFGGFSAMGNKADVKAGKSAAYDVYQEQLGLLGSKRDLATEQAQSQYTTGMEELSLGTQTGISGITTGGDVAMSQSGLATSGTIQSQMDKQMKGLLAGHATTAKKQVDTKKYAEAQADLAFRSGKMSAEDAYQDTLTGLEAIPTTFMEGMFG